MEHSTGHWLHTQYWYVVVFCCCCSVTKSCPTLCNPMNCCTPGFPVLHYLPEFAQTRVHWVSDAIQPSHPLSLPSPSALNLSQYQGFSSGSVLHIKWPKYWSFSFSINPFNEHSGLISFRIDRFDHLCRPKDSQIFSSTTIWKHQFFGTQPSLWANSHICTWLLEKP